MAEGSEFRTGDSATRKGLGGQRVLVTGASGFIGSHLVRALMHQGAEVHVLLRSGASRERLADVYSSLRIWTGDVTDRVAVRAAVDGARPEVVYHLAADTGVRRLGTSWDGIERGIRVNLEGTLAVLHASLEARHGVRTIIRTGGLEEYGDGPAPYDESQRERPISPYSASQVAATYYAQMLQHDATAAIVTLRPALVYGPAQSADFFIPSLITACLRGQTFAMTDGQQRRDLLYVDDLVAALICVARTPGLGGEVVNVGHGVAHAMRSVAERIVALAGGTGRLDVGAVPTRARDIRNLVTKTERAMTLLGWSPRVQLDEGLSRTVDWYRQHLA